MGQGQLDMTADQGPQQSKLNDDSPVPANPPATARQQTLARINMRIFPFLYSIYTLALFELLTVSFAIHHGLCQELHLDDDRIRLYTVIAVLSAPYCILEIPVRLLVLKFGPHIWLALSLLLFGITIMIQGMIQSYSGLLTTRFFLGFFELCTVTGIFYATGLWYPRWEAQYRHDSFFTFIPLVAGFGALVLVPTDKLNGLGGYSGFRWAFFFQGGLAIILGLLAFFRLPGFPENSEWLSKDEKEFVVSRRSTDPSRCIRQPQITFGDSVNIFKSKKIILGVAIYLCLVIPAYLYEHVSPPTNKESSYYKVLVQLHGIPPWVPAIAFGSLVGPFSGFNSWH